MVWAVILSAGCSPLNPTIFPTSSLMKYYPYSPCRQFGDQVTQPLNPIWRLKFLWSYASSMDVEPDSQKPLALQRKDIDFNNGTIFLRKTKFSKERLIPVHDSLLVILERYCLTLGIMLSPDAFLFPGRNPDRPFTSRQMAFWFEELLRITNIGKVNKEPRARGASLHCLRHLFVLKSAAIGSSRTFCGYERSAASCLSWARVPARHRQIYEIFRCAGS